MPSTGDDEVVFARDHLASPAQLFRLDARGSETALTSFNASRLAAIAFGAHEQFSFSGWNGEKVYGYVVKPWNFQAGKTYHILVEGFEGAVGTYDLRLGCN